MTVSYLFLCLAYVEKYFLKVYNIIIAKDIIFMRSWGIFMNVFKSTIGKYFIFISVIPVILTGVIITFLSTSIIYNVKVDDTKTMLDGIAKEVAYSYDLLDRDSNNLYIYNDEVYLGDTKISGNYSVVERIKTRTGVDVSFFYEDTRIVTTLRDADNNRLTGKKATQIWNDYVSKGQTYFSENVIINDTISYFGYYIPVFSDDGKVQGMAFAGIPSKDIQDTIDNLNRRAIILCVCLIVGSLFVCSFFSKRILKLQNNIMVFMKALDEGNSSYKVDENMLKRKDEFGIMSRYCMKMNQNARNLIEYDGLTGIYNRRAAMRQLEKYVQDANAVSGETFCLAIGDIDFFKKVNDSYGHNCGDEVLKMVAGVLSSIPKDEGFAARWGGEEFVIVYKGKLHNAVKKLEVLADKIKASTVEYEQYKINITMTFGIAEYIAPRNVDILISNADNLLYKGKESGRNKIVN